MRIVFIIFGGVLCLSGCQLFEPWQRAQQKFVQEKEHIDFLQQSVRHSVQTKAPTQHIEQPWVVGKVQPLARELILPPAFQADVSTTLIFQTQALNLDQIAERIALATQIPVRVQPEAKLSPESFLPAGQAKLGQAATRRLRLMGNPEPLAQSLDRISAFFDVSWRFSGEFIEFYKVETRSFKVRALSLAATSHARVGNQVDEATGFSSQSGTELYQADTDEWQNLKARLALFMTGAGRIVAVNGGSQTVVVSDTPFALDQIALFLESENQALTRRVRLVFEEITLGLKTESDFNIDWNVIFESAQLAASATLTGIANPAVQQLGAAIKQGPFSQSEAFIKALAEVAQVVRRNSIPVLSLNRRPVTHALRTTFSYIDKVENTPYSIGNGAMTHSISLSQKEETVGSILTLVPDIQDDGQVLLSVAYDNTVAQPLKTIAVGSEDQGMQVQQLTVEGSATVQQVLLRPGQPLIIAGFDHNEQQQTERSMAPGLSMLFGGGKRLQDKKFRTLLMITAQVEEGM